MSDLRCLLADAGHAGDIVRCVSHETHDLDHPVRRHAEAFFHVPGLVDLVLERVIDLYAGSHELEEVLVTRDDCDFHAARLGIPGERGDHIVGLLAFDHEDRDTERLHQFVDIGDLGDEVSGHGRPVGLVFLVFTMSAGRTLRIEHDGKQVRCLVLDNFKSIFAKPKTAFVGMPVEVLSPRIA